MPEAKIELDHQSPWQLLVAVILSAQSTDRRVNLVTPALHEAFPGPADYARATPQQVEAHIKTLGLFRNKAKSLVALGRELLATHQGVVPRTRAALAALPGVGNKTAGVVSMHIGGDRAFPVDTHVMRLSNRLGFTRHEKPDAIEEDLRALLPEEKWFQGHQLLVWHGRRVCHAQGPECHRCVVAELCPKRGVKLKKPKKARATPTARRLLSRPPRGRS
ncbi:MAG: endonuclease III [Myxococcaceae bacterium]|nr:endonuclease III [Myxococcaceae bacterium]